MIDNTQMIEQKIRDKFSKFITYREFTKQKFNPVERSDIKTYSVNVNITGNVVTHLEDGQKVTNFHKPKLIKDLNSLLTQTYSALNAIDIKDNDFEYIIVDTDLEEFKDLKRVGNTQFFYNVVEQDLIKYDLRHLDVTTEAEVLEELEKLANDPSAKYEQTKNGVYFVNIFMFVRLI